MIELNLQQFVQDWIDAWNSHDLDRILSHYSDNVDYQSPFVVELMRRADGRLRGKVELRDYVAGGLSSFPQLNFKLLGHFAGVNSVVIHYRSVKNLIAAETLCLDARGKIERVIAHYQQS